MVPPRKYDGEERRVAERESAYLRIFGHRLDLTLKNVLAAMTLISASGAGIGWFLNRFVFPWPTRAEVGIATEAQAVAIEAVKLEHQKTRQEIGELKSEMALAAQTLCVLTRKFAPENAPKGCTLPPRVQNGEPQ